MADFNEYKGVWVFCEQRQGKLMPRFSQVVVLPVPPFWLTIAIVVHFFAIKSPPRRIMRKVMVHLILIG